MGTMPSLMAWALSSMVLARTLIFSCNASVIRQISMMARRPVKPVLRQARQPAGLKSLFFHSSGKPMVRRWLSS